MLYSPVWSSAVMIPRYIFKKVGLFSVALTRGEDLHMWAKIALRYRVALSPEDGAIYHLSSDNRACNSLIEAEDVAIASAIEEFMKTGDVPVSSWSMAQECLAYRRLQLAKYHFLTNNKKLAYKLLHKTNEIRLYRKKRIILKFVFLFIPIPFVNIIVAIKRCVIK